MSFTYVVTSQKPTAVSASCVCAFTSPTDRNLIIAKGNHLEIHTMRENGLVPEFDVPLFGNITALDVYRPADSSQDVLFILTAKKHFCVLGWDAVNRKLVPRSAGNVKERVGRDIASGQRAFVDPDQRIIATLLYEGLLKVIPIEATGLKEAYNLRIEMLRFLDLKFLYGCSRPTLCMLYEDNRGCRHLKTWVVDARDKELVPGPWTESNVEHGARLLIPVPSPTNGVIVVGETTITYLGDGNGVVQSVAIQHTQIVTYGMIGDDEARSRYLLGDHRGFLYVLVLAKDSNSRVVSVVMDLVGQTSIAETLSYLDNGVVFVGSIFGDSQLIRLRQIPDSDGSCVEVIDNYMNIGPVVDMCVVTSERQGSCSVVTCSGAFKDGSLRVIRSGIGIHEQASLEQPGIKGLWSLRHGSESAFDKYLVQAFIGQTRVMRIENEEMEEIEIDGFTMEQQSLFCGNVSGDMIVQVVPTGARLVDCNTLRLIDEFPAPASKRITVATGSTEQLVMALAGGELLYLEVNPTTRRLMQVASVALDQDIACMSLHPGEQTDPGAMEVAEDDSGSASGSGAMIVEGECPTGKTSSSASAMLAVGMWTDSTVRLFTLPSLAELTRVTLGLETQTQARDVLLATLGEAGSGSSSGSGSGSGGGSGGSGGGGGGSECASTSVVYLMVGLGDGTLITFTIDDSAGLPTLVGRRKVVLGMHPISLTLFANKGVPCVFAACDRPTVVYTRNGKLVFSVVNISPPEVTGMAPFHSELFPECLALSSEAGLMIGMVDEIQKLHVTKHPLGEAPLRIAHSTSCNAFAVTSERTVCTDRGEETTCRVLFLDDGSYQQLCHYDLDPMEQGIACCTCRFEGSAQDYFVVGTAVVIPEEQEPSKGRILVFEVIGSVNGGLGGSGGDGDDRRLNLVVEKETKGAVFCVASMNGRLIAGVGSKVHVYRLHTGDPTGSSSSMMVTSASAASSELSLQHECTHHGHILAMYLKAHGDFVLVGDILRSVTLLQYKAPTATTTAMTGVDTENGTLEEISRDFNSNFMRAVEMVGDDEHFLGADDNGNLFTVRRRADAATDEERGKMEAQGEFHLGDNVNVFRRGSLNSQPADPEAVTGEGAGSGTGSNQPTTTTSTPGNAILNTPALAAVAGPNSTSMLFGTTSGAIGTIITLNHEAFVFFSSLERAIRAVVPAQGGLSHEDWRSFYNERRCTLQRNSVDGDLVEMFLDLDRGRLEQVVRAMNDELATISANTAGGGGRGGSGGGGGGGGGTPSLQGLLSGDAKAFSQLSVEDCVRRVEDMARLH